MEDKKSIFKRDNHIIMTRIWTTLNAFSILYNISLMVIRRSIIEIDYTMSMNTDIIGDIVMLINVDRYFRQNYLKLLIERMKISLRKY